MRVRHSNAGLPSHPFPLAVLAGVVAIGCPGDKHKVDPSDPTPKSERREHPSFGSRFSIFIRPEEHFNGKLPVIGVVLQGLDVVQKAAKQTPVDAKRRPEIKLVIAECGELTGEQRLPVS